MLRLPSRGRRRHIARRRGFGNSQHRQGRRVGVRHERMELSKSQDQNRIPLHPCSLGLVTPCPQPSQKPFLPHPQLRSAFCILKSSAPAGICTLPPLLSAKITCCWSSAPPSTRRAAGCLSVTPFQPTSLLLGGESALYPRCLNSSKCVLWVFSLSPKMLGSVFISSSYSFTRVQNSYIKVALFNLLRVFSVS